MGHLISEPIPQLGTNGAELPAIGLGTSGLGDCGEIVATALGLGYRLIDTAWKYGSERGVGEGMRISRVPRNEIFLTTKVSHEYLRADDFARSVDEKSRGFGSRLRRSAAGALAQSEDSVVRNHRRIGQG